MIHLTIYGQMYTTRFSRIENEIFTHWTKRNSAKLQYFNIILENNVSESRNFSEYEFIDATSSMRLYYKLNE